jgi:hypothetical protein
VTVHVCGSDGQPIGQFEEADFRDKIFAGELLTDSYYWHEGMTDWKPLSEYRALAKTQRISFTPPVRRTIRIATETAQTDHAKTESVAAHGSLARFWRRITSRKKAD